MCWAAFIAILGWVLTTGYYLVIPVITKSLFLFMSIFLLGFYLFIFREEGSQGERGEKHQFVVASHAPYWGPGPKPRHVPWLGIKPVTFWFTGLYSVHWAIPASAITLNHASIKCVDFFTRLSLCSGHLFYYFLSNWEIKFLNCEVSLNNSHI